MSYNCDESLIAVKELPGRGRSIVAVSALKVGQCIGSVEPYAAVVCDGLQPGVCDACFARSDGAKPHPKRCTQCNGVWYCSAKCEQANSDLHKLECLCLASLQQLKVETRGVRMVIRCLASQIIEQMGRAATAARKGTTSDFNALCDNVGSLSAHQAREFGAIARGVSKFPVAVGRSEEELIAIVSKLRCNSRGVADMFGQRIGDAVYAPDNMNHSCTPTAIASFDGLKMNIHTIAKVEAGEEVMTSYTETYKTRSERRQKMLATHSFVCHCARCVDDSTDAPDRFLAAVKCAKKGCADGIVVPNSGLAVVVDEQQSDEGHCTTCGVKVADVSAPAKKAVLYLTSAKQAEAAGEVGKACTLAMQAAKWCDESLHPLHEIRYTVMSNVVDIFTRCNMWEAALSTCSDALACSKAVYPKFHPRIACLATLLGDICIRLNDEDIEKAVGAQKKGKAGVEAAKKAETSANDSLVRALRAYNEAFLMLKLSYGASHPETVKVTEKLAYAKARQAAAK